MQLLIMNVSLWLMDLRKCVLKGDGHSGKSKISCERGRVLKRETSNQDKYFNLLDFTPLTSEPIRCCIILAGVFKKPIAETCVNFTKERVGDIEDNRFFEEKFGK